MARKYNYEDVKKYILKLGSTLITEEKDYKHVRTKLEILCSCKRNRFYITFKDIKRSKNPDICKCKVCGDNARRWTYGELKCYINKYTNVEFATEYENDIQLIDIDKDLILKCKCGNLFNSSLDNFHSKRRGNYFCEKCASDKKSIRLRKNIKDVYNGVLSKGYRIIKFIEPHKNAHSKFLVECKEGHNYISNYDNIVIKKRNCQQCVGNGLKTHEDFVDDIQSITNGEYTIIGQYKNAKTKIQTKHNKCGHVWDVNPKSLLDGHGCPECNGGIIHTHKQYCDRMIDLVQNEYSPMEEYKDSITPINVRHNECGYEWKVKPIKFFYGSRCPQCSIHMSKGEQKIQYYLKKNNIKFEQEYLFDGLTGIGGGVLRFDFAIFNENKNKLIKLIEYDGIQHYEPIEYFGGQSQLEHQKQNDKIKNNYCKENNISLLRIPYWDFFNIDNILKKHI